MSERDIIQSLSENYASGTESFRDALLQRCLQVMGTRIDPKDIEDKDLEWLAAAGTVQQIGRRHD